MCPCVSAVSHGAGDTRVSSSTGTNKRGLSASQPQPTSLLPPALPLRHELAQGPRHVSVHCLTRCGMPLGLSPWSHSPRGSLHRDLGASSYRTAQVPATVPSVCLSWGLWESSSCALG